MPEMDGVTMLKKIKSNSNVSDIPVILLTSKSEVENRLEGLRKGADAFLAKPFNMEELHILIDNLVDNVRRIRGKYSGAQGQKAKIEQIQVKGNNDALMERVMNYMNEHLADQDLNVEKLTSRCGYQPCPTAPQAEGDSRCLCRRIHPQPATGTGSTPDRRRTDQHHAGSLLRGLQQPDPLLYSVQETLWHVTK